MATCLCPLLVLRLPITRGGSSECICRGSLSSLIFQSSLMSLAFFVLMIFSSFCQLVRLTSPPSVNQSAAVVLLPKRIRIDRTTVRTLLIGRHLQRCGASSWLYFSLRSPHYTAKLKLFDTLEWHIPGRQWAWPPSTSGDSPSTVTDVSAADWLSRRSDAWPNFRQFTRQEPFIYANVRPFGNLAWCLSVHTVECPLRSTRWRLDDRRERCPAVVLGEEGREDFP